MWQRHFKNKLIQVSIMVPDIQVGYNKVILKRIEATICCLEVHHVFGVLTINS